MADVGVQILARVKVFRTSFENAEKVLEIEDHTSNFFWCRSKQSYCQWTSSNVFSVRQVGSIMKVHEHQGTGPHWLIACTVHGWKRLEKGHLIFFFCITRSLPLDVSIVLRID